MRKVAFVCAGGRESDSGGSRVFSVPSPMRGLLEGLAEISDFHFYILSCYEDEPGTDTISGPNITLIPVRVSRNSRLRTLYFDHVRQIRKALSEIHPDIVHGQGTEKHCGLAAALSGYPSAITIHGNMNRVAKTLGRHGGYAYLMISALERFATWKTDGCVFLTQDSQGLFRKRSDAYAIIPNTIERSWVRSEPRPQRFRSFNLGTPPHILMVGDILAYKNQVQMLRWLHRTPPHNHHISVVGNKSMQKEYVREFERVCAEHPNIRFYGELPRNAIKELYNEVDLVVHGSLEDNCPMSLLEGMACGCRILASNVGGIPETVHGYAGARIFDVKDFASFQRGFQQLLEDTNDAALHLPQRCTPSSVAEAHIEFYRRILC